MAAFLFISLALSISLLVEGGGFSVELFHRDSPMSPLYDSSATRFDRWRAAADRSHQRARHFANRHLSTPGSCDGGSILSPVIPDSGSYLMKLALGTPPVSILAIADTGSDLIWTDCVPCAHCYKQKTPLFNPADSWSYSDISCLSDSCNALPKHSCDNCNKCQYQYLYGDNSTVAGLLATETFTFNLESGGDVYVEATVFGCSHESNGTFDINVGGLVGLGGGELSLVSQLGDSISHQFSYCLQPWEEVNKSSRLVFGPNSHAPKGELMVTTPILDDEEHETYYTLRLIDITVGNKIISTASSSESKIIIDSGTVLTYLHNRLLDEVVKEMKKRVNLPPVTDPKNHPFEICFSTSIEKVEFPEVSFVFDGAKVPLKKENVLVEVANKVTCLAIVPLGTSVGIQIYGNVAQIGFYVAYDLGKRQLSIAPANCTKL